MTVSTTLQSKISRTKKRLSEDRWSTACWLLAIFGLFVGLGQAMRGVLLSRMHGTIDGEIPVVMTPVDDPGLHRFSARVEASLRRTTATVVMTADAFYVSDMKAFSEDFADPGNKYIIRHIDQEPQLQTLVTTMDKWFEERARENEIRPDGLVVFAPSGEIPMPIVMQVMDGLKMSRHIQKVVMAAGIL